MLRSLFSKLRPKAAAFNAPVRPDGRFAVIGDIHGRVDLLEHLLAQLDPDIQVICLGDYVDRGDHSADVLRLLYQRPDIICLKGNHEEMMLDFLTNPAKYGPRWLRHGGLQTLASFSISGVSESASGATLSKARNDLFEAMGQPLINWLTTLPLSWQSGNVAIVHAAADPSLPMDSQPEPTLLRGHPEFAITSRRDGMWVVHGHTIVDAPHAADGRISIDTAAYATGRLTAAIITSDGVEFVTT